MSFLKRITSLLIRLCFIGMLVLAVSAAPITGSIRLRLVCGGEAVGGGSVKLYRVGEAAGEKYGLSPEFSGSGADLSKLSDPAAAATLAEYARTRNIPGQTQPVDEAGTVRFAPLETGVYLIVQDESSPGYEPVLPFLVTIPLMVGERVCYDIDASPKVALTPDPTTPTAPTDPWLPQTGRLNWPVPAMAAAGALLFGAGGILRFGKRKNPRTSGRRFSR